MTEKTGPEDIAWGFVAVMLSIALVYFAITGKLVWL